MRLFEGQIEVSVRPETPADPHQSDGLLRTGRNAGLGTLLHFVSEVLAMRDRPWRVTMPLHSCCVVHLLDHAHRCPGSGSYNLTDLVEVLGLSVDPLHDCVEYVEIELPVCDVLELLDQLSELLDHEVDPMTLVQIFPLPLSKLEPPRIHAC